MSRCRLSSVCGWGGRHPREPPHQAVPPLTYWPLLTQHLCLMSGVCVGAISTWGCLQTLGIYSLFCLLPWLVGERGGAVEGRGKIRLNTSGGVQHPSALFSYPIGSHLGPCNHWHPSSRSPALWFGFSGPGFVRFTQGSQGHARGVSLLGYLLLCNHVWYDPESF